MVLPDRERLVDEWKRCAPWLERALDGTYAIQDVWTDVWAGRAQFWPLERSAAVTRIHDYPQASVLRIWLAGGEMDDLLANMWRLEEFARETGCKAIELEGRKGWERVMPDFRLVSVTLRRDI